MERKTAERFSGYCFEGTPTNFAPIGIGRKLKAVKRWKKSDFKEIP
jgi:hypothetical protein